MTRIEIEALTAALAPVVREFVDKAVASSADRLGNVEKAISEFRQSPDDLDSLIAQAATKAASDAILTLPTPKDGQSVTVADLEPLIAGEVAKAVAAIPPPADGKSITTTEVEPLILEQVHSAFKAMSDAFIVGLEDA